MDTAFPEVPWVPRDHDENRTRIPPEELARFRGMHVAFSWDGSRIVAGAPTLEELFAYLDGAGIDSRRVVFDYLEHL